MAIRMLLPCLGVASRIQICTNQLSFIEWGFQPHRRELELFRCTFSVETPSAWVWMCMQCPYRYDRAGPSQPSVFLVIALCLEMHSKNALISINIEQGTRMSQKRHSKEQLKVLLIHYIPLGWVRWLELLRTIHPLEIGTTASDNKESGMFLGGVNSFCRKFHLTCLGDIHQGKKCLIDYWQIGQQVRWPLPHNSADCRTNSKNASWQGKAVPHQ